MDNQFLFYTEKGHADKKYWANFMINPLKAYWGYECTNDWGVYAHQYDWLKELYKPTDNIDNAEAVFLPFTLNYYINSNNIGLVDDLVSFANSKSKRFYCWVHGDHEIDYKNPDSVFFKFFSFNSRRLKNEIILPANMYTDISKENSDSNIIYRNKKEIPSIGFDGVASYSLSKIIPVIAMNTISKVGNKFFGYRYLQESIFPPMIKRKKILSKIDNSKKLNTNFNYRDQFSIGIVGKNNTARQQYIDSIVNNDYTLCYRGAGNYSMRLFEVLCLGRIPLFINTDCVLPFENEIDWRDILIWIEEKDVDNINDIVLEYHNSLSNKEFIERQAYCREIWLKYCSTKGQYKQIVSLLRNN